MFCTFLISHLESSFFYQYLHSKYIFYTQTGDSFNYFCIISVRKWIFSYKQHPLVTYCNQSLDHCVQRQECGVHCCWVSLILSLSYWTPRAHPGPILDFSQLCYCWLWHSFKMLVFWNSAKIILSFIIAKRDDVISIIHALGLLHIFYWFCIFPLDCIFSTNRDSVSGIYPQH